MFRHVKQFAVKLSLYCGAQSLIQMANIASGFLLVRAMTKVEFAWTTIVLSSMATISVLADSGLGSAFTSIGGKTYLRPTVFSAVASLVRRMRLFFLCVASAVTLPITIWALLQNGASTSIVTVLCFLILLAAIPSTDAVVLMTVNRIHGRLRNLVTADLTLSLSKLVLILVLIYCIHEISVVGVTLCLLITLWMQILVLRYQTSDLLPPSRIDVGDYSGKIWKTVLNVLPICIFTCIQAQLTVYILTFFAGVSEVADLGALSRLSVVFSFISIPFGQLYLPIIARCQQPNELWKLMGRTVLILGGAVLVIVLLTYVFAGVLLMILGEQYLHLEYELMVFMLVSSIGFVSNSLWGLAFTRGWVAGGWIVIPLTLVLQFIVVSFLKLNVLSGAIVFSAFSPVASLMVGTWLIVSGFRREFPSRLLDPT